MATSEHLGSLNQEKRKALEKRLHDRQAGKCFICDETVDLVLHEGQLDVDHIDPLAEDGADAENNFALTHQSCNTRSGRRILEKIQPAWLTLVEILHRVEEQPFHQPVGRTTFQKIAFVATEEGIPTGLKYVRDSYGPYSRGLDEIRKRLADANLIREERLGRTFEVKTGRSYEEARKRFKSELDRWKVPITKTSDLFLRMDTNQAEITATILFAANHLVNTSSVTERDIFNAVMEWKPKRRPQLEAHAVGDAIRNLGMLRWVNAAASANLPGVIDEFGD